MANIRPVPNRRLPALSRRLERLGTTYAEYLNSDHWRAKRTEYYASDFPQRCVVCDRTPFELHHITYQRLGKELLGDLLPLCRECHGRVHRHADTHTTGLHSIAKILRAEFGMHGPDLQRRLERFNVQGVKNPEQHMDVLTPKQRMRVMRKQDPTNPAYWTTNQKRKRGL